MLSRTRTIIACTAAAAAAGLAVGLAAPALAATGAVARPHGQFRFAGTNHAAGRAAATPANTRGFAGYQATVAPGSATVLEASFTVPALTCTTTDRAIAPSTGVPETNNSISAAFVFVGCVSNVATFYPGLVDNGKETDFTSNPFAVGDVVDVITKVSTNRTRVEVTDVTTGFTQKIIGAGAKATAAFIGDEGWGDSSGRLEHVPAFGKLTFKNCMLDGKSLASFRPQSFNWVNSIGTLQISTGNFWPGGTAFTTHFVHS